MPAYYNENDAFCAAWLRNLIAAGHIAPGDVDERSIVDVQPDDVRGYQQCHWFAGIGGWSHALRLAGWADDRPVWTGSCPCQPFSNAGRQRGSDDERHLWPAWFRLIRECAPPTVFGEQVSGAAGLAWLDHVHADLECEGYAVAAADLCAAGVGAPHIRQRLYFMADTERRPAERHGYEVGDAAHGMQGAPRQQRIRTDLGHGGATRNLADADSERCQIVGRIQPGLGPRLDVDRCESPGLMAHAEGERPMRRESAGRTARHRIELASSLGGFWTNGDWLRCRDGKARPVESGTFPLAHGVPARMGRLRAYGNAIVPQVAAAFVSAFMEVNPIPVLTQPSQSLSGTDAASARTNLEELE